ncbi:MAG: indolepyruvate oxidoreductase subunit beta [Lachnospiraceae bacterium]|nr:indolepyruvate oxidoreductase subunit beta [Lachnospiraceae bacterium]
MEENKNVLLCGVGGQGTILASRLIALAAMEKGMEARGAETIGMSQRGGSVVSHVRTGRNIHSPLIPHGKADVIIGFEPAEAVRCLPYLKKGGCMVVCPSAIKPVTAALSDSGYDGSQAMEYLKAVVQKLSVVDGQAICGACGSPKVLNVALLGAAVASGLTGVSLEEMEAAIRKRVPEKFKEMNLKALRLGAEAQKQGSM